MKSRRYAVVVGLLSLVALAGVGAMAREGASSPADEKGGPHPQNPNAGLTEAQIREKDDAMIPAQLERNRKFLASWNASGRDPRTLERVPFLAELGVEILSFDQGARDATLVIRGVVKRVDFTEGASTATIEVTRSWGSVPAPSSITVVQLGGPVMNEPENRAVLGQVEWDPLLLPGDDAVLFLEKRVYDGTFHIFPFHQYLIRKGQIVPPPGSPVFEAEAVPTLDAFLARVSAARP